jgi:hypothetical protein
MVNHWCQHKKNLFLAMEYKELKPIQQKDFALF